MTLKHLRLLILIALFCAGAMLNAAVIDRTIAKLNDDIMTESDLAEVQADSEGHFTTGSTDPFLTATSETVASMFDRQLLVQEARRLKISPTQDEMNLQVENMVREIRAKFASEKEFHQALAHERISLDTLKDELLEKSKVDFMVFQVINSRFSVTDSEIPKYQGEMKASGQSLTSYHLRRLGIAISKKVPAAAASARARQAVSDIIQKGISFEEGVRRYSEIPGADLDGGDLGYLSSDKLNKDVLAAVENLEAGQATAPIIAGGYANIFYLDGKRGARSALREEKFFETRDQLLKELRRRADLQIFDKRLLPLLSADYEARAKSPDLSAKNATAEPAPATATADSSSAAKRQGEPAPAAPATYQPTPAPTPQQTPAGLFQRMFRQRSR